MISKSNRRALALAAAIACVSSSALAAPFVWNGTNNTWTSLNWNAGVGGPLGADNTNSATINGGTVTFSGNDHFGNDATAASPVITINSGGTLASGGWFNTMWNLTLNGSSLLANGGANIVYGAFKLSGTVTVGGSVASNISLGSGGNNSVTLGAISGGFTTFNVADVTNSTATDLTVSTVLSTIGPAASGLIKGGPGTMTLTAANTYFGVTTINGGRLVYQNTYASPSHVIAAGATLEFNVASAMDGATTSFSGGGTLVKSGSGYLYWSQSAATFEMGAGSLIDVQAGTFVVGSYANEIMNNSLADLNVAEGATFDSGACNAFVNALNGSGLIRLAYDNNYPRTLTMGVNNGGGTFSGALTDGGTGNGNVVKTGSGTQILSGMNTFTGNVVINNGTIAAGSFITGYVATSIPSNLGDLGTAVSRSITINNGGILSLTNGNVLGQGGSNGTHSGVTLIVNQGGVFQSGLNAAGAGWWNKIGAVNLNGGTIRIGSGANTTNFQGLALIGTVTVGGATASTIDNHGSSNSASNAIHLGQNATAGQMITFNVADVTGDSVSDLNVSAKLLNTSATLTASGLIKTGVGTMTVSGANTYTGATNVSAGTLSVAAGGSINGSTSLTVSNSAILSVDGLVASPVILNNTSTLKGKGTISGLVTTSAGTTVAPGTGTGTGTGILTLSNAGGFNLAAGAHLAIKINSATAGTGYDQLLVTGGNVVLAGDLGGSALGFTPATGDTFYFLRNTGSGTTAGTLNGVSDGGKLDVGGRWFRVSFTSTQGGVGFQTGGSGKDVAIQRINDQTPGAFAASIIGPTDQAVAQLKLTWVNNATTATGFYLYRVLNGGALQAVSTFGANDTSYSEVISSAAVYTYAIQAFDASGVVGDLNYVTSPKLGNTLADRQKMVLDYLQAVTPNLTQTGAGPARIGRTGFFSAKAGSSGVIRQMDLTSLPRPSRMPMPKALMPDSPSGLEWMPTCAGAISFLPR